MKILHLLSGGGIGGIEMLCRNIASLSADENEFCFLYSGGELTDEIESSGATVYRYYLKGMMVRFWSLWSLVHRRKYDVVIVHHEGIGIYLFYLMLCQCFQDTKFIKYLHCSYEEEYLFTGKKLKDGFIYLTLKKALQKSDYIIAVSEFVKKSYQMKFDFGDTKASVVYNGISLESLSNPALPKANTTEVIRLLYIGRLVEMKGIRLLLYAVRNLMIQGYSVELEVLGDGPDRIEYEQLTRELGIEKNVFFRGYELNKKPYYAVSQIFVYPSICMEAFGISIVEAQAAGLVCVASRVGGIPEIISDEQDGFLFEKGNIRDLVTALLKAMDVCRSSQYAEFQKVTQSKAMNFSARHMVKELDAICKRLV